jgi:predicted dithiol-disulfide oxidoreductase (DUF899 family)
MNRPKIVSRNEWLEARKAFLAKEKAFSRVRDELAAERRKLPMVKVDKEYVFDSTDGKTKLRDLFGKHPQLVVYHLMFDPKWDAACKSCSLIIDNVQGSLAHFGARGISFVAVSRAPVAKIEAFKKRMGWKQRWVSSENTDFNYDYGVSFREGETGGYNYGDKNYGGESPGLSVFMRDGGDVFHTYSSYARGLDILINTYNYIDLTPLGRQEENDSNGMKWVKLHDQYEAS